MHSKPKMEIRIYRLLITLRIVGFLGMAFSPNLVFLIISLTFVSASGGAYDTLKALITSFCEERDITTLYLVLTTWTLLLALWEAFCGRTYYHGHLTWEIWIVHTSRACRTSYGIGACDPDRCGG
jgi:hypothetical protein